MKIVQKIGAVVGMTACMACTMLKPEFTNQENYFLSASSANDTNVYVEKPSEGFLPVLTFRNHASDTHWITGLALTHFSGDSIYDDIEIQKIEYAGKRGISVLLYHSDHSLIDVYYPADMPLSKLEIDQMVNHSELHPTDFTADFGTDSSRFGMRMNLTDKYGRDIRLSILEKKASDQPIKFIAPIGSGIKKPQYFPLLYLENMGFVSKKQTTYSLTIAGQEMKAASIPFSAFLQTRYTDSVVNAEWLPQSDTLISVIGFGKQEGTINRFISNHGYMELKSQRYDYHGKRLRFNYQPAIPDLMALKNDIQMKGRFCVQTNTGEGIMAGQYTIQTSNEKINIVLVPENGWQPMPGKCWIKSYRWEAELVRTKNNSYHFVSGWRRVTH